MNMDEARFENISNIIKNNPKILSSPDLLKINRSMSYMTFILREIYDYYSQKTPDGVHLFTIRNFKNEIQSLSEKLNKLESTIK
jgi:hypothetical protein